MMNILNNPFNPRQIAASAAEIFSVRLKGRPVCITLEIDDAVPCRLNGDGFRLKQVLANLISIAIAHTEKGRIHIALSVSSDDSATGTTRLRIEVFDTGMGISEAQLDALFLQRADLDTGIPAQYGARKGVGLKICRWLVDLMGGVVGANCSEGKGSLLWLEVDFAKGCA